MSHDEYEARDIWLAAYLDVMGVPFLHAVPMDGRRCRFLFRNDGDKAYELALEWREGINALVSGPALVASYRKMAGISRAASIGEEPIHDRRIA